MKKIVFHLVPDLVVPSAVKLKMSKVPHDRTRDLLCIWYRDITANSN
jgi:hypothetical protein